MTDMDPAGYRGHPMLARDVVTLIRDLSASRAACRQYADAADRHNTEGMALMAAGEFGEAGRELQVAAALQHAANWERIVQVVE